MTEHESQILYLFPSDCHATNKWLMETDNIFEIHADEVVHRSLVTIGDRSLEQAKPNEKELKKATARRLS